ncbi:MAG: M15 family metallopeptidase [Spirochaetales bacterium]
MSRSLSLTILMLLTTLAFAEALGSAEPRHLVDDGQATEGFQTHSFGPFPPQQVLQALRAAYPDKVQAIERRDGDWAIQVADTWFYWEGGRLLSAGERERALQYEPIPFYSYPRELPEVPEYTEAERESLEARVAAMEENPPRRYYGFYDAVWRAPDEASAYARQKTIYFLGMMTMVHRELLEDVASIEEEILELATRDREVRAFLDRLSWVAGYHFRNVDGTSFRSNHSYGAALDLMPERFSGEQAYWRWTMRDNITWYSVPNEERYLIPMSVVEIFERHGFIWGGKWRFFDTIHFEYRPEILILNGYEIDHNK